MGSANGAARDSRGPPGSIALQAGPSARSSGAVATSSSAHSASKKDSAPNTGPSSGGGKDVTSPMGDGQAKGRRYDQRRESLVRETERGREGGRGRNSDARRIV